MVSYNTQSALGMVETYGYVAHIEAADQCLKAANVRLIGSEKVRGGYMHIKIIGDVGAVKAAIDAAEAAVERLGAKVVTHVIPRPSEDVQKLIYSHIKETNKNVSDESRNSDESNKVDKKEIKIKNKPSKSSEKKEQNNIQDLKPDAEQLAKMNVAKLRVVARSLDNISLDKNQINFGKKQELIDAILQALKEEGNADEDN